MQGVDIQNQPFSGIWPIPSGESWICDIADHLKFNLGLDAANIAVISGGISGAQTVDGIQNFPDSAMDCAAIDIIGIHGYFTKEHDATAGTSWAQMFVPGNTLTARAKGKKGQGKLLLVEEWAYVHSNKFGHFYKKEALFDQGNALNLRGIPWVCYNTRTSHAELIRVPAVLSSHYRRRRTQRPSQSSPPILRLLESTQRHHPTLLHSPQQFRLVEIPPSSSQRPNKLHSPNSQPLHPRTERLHLRLRRPPLRLSRRLCPRPPLQEQHLHHQSRIPTGPSRRNMQQQESLPGTSNLLKRNM